MPQQTAPAVPTQISSVKKRLADQKLRLAGRLLAYDAETATVLLMDGAIAVLVDVTLCIQAWSSSWVRNTLAIIMVIGYLEISDISLSIPNILVPGPTANLAVDTHLVLRALVMIPSDDLDLGLWNSTIAARDDVLAESCKAA